MERGIVVDGCEAALVTEFRRLDAADRLRFLTIGRAMLDGRLDIQPKQARSMSAREVRALADELGAQP